LPTSARQAINGALSVRRSAPDDASCVVWTKQQLSEAGLLFDVKTVGASRSCIFCTRPVLCSVESVSFQHVQVFCFLEVRLMSVSISSLTLYINLLSYNDLRGSKPLICRNVDKFEAGNGIGRSVKQIEIIER